MKSIENVNCEEILIDNCDNVSSEEKKILNLPYYYNDVDRSKSESILRLMNRPGCFLIRKHESSSSSSCEIESPYVLSMIGPSLKMSHYLLYRLKECLFLKPYSCEYYNSIKDLVDAHRENNGILPCTLVEYPVRLKSINKNLSSSSSTISKCSRTSSSSSSLIIETNKLICQQIIGRGHFGIVYKGLYNDEISVAIKTFSISCNLSVDECQSNMLSEARTMMNLNHPYLIHFYGISSCDNRLCLVTEYMPNGCLLSWVQQQSSNVCLLRRRLGLFSLQICDAMSYLESKLIIHRDLAARNCLVDENADIVKVSDFGMARVLSSSSMIYEDDLIHLFHFVGLHLNQTPFGEAVSNDLTAKLIRSGRMPTKPTLSNEFIFRQVISPCWAWKPNDRPSFSSLKETLNKALSLLPKFRSFSIK